VSAIAAEDGHGGIAEQRDRERHPQRGRRTVVSDDLPNGDLVSYVPTIFDARVIDGCRTKS